MRSRISAKIILASGELFSAEGGSSRKDELLRMHVVQIIRVGNEERVPIEPVKTSQVCEKCQIYTRFHHKRTSNFTIRKGLDHKGLNVLRTVVAFWAVFLEKPFSTNRNHTGPHDIPRFL